MSFKAVLPQIHALPRPERELAVLDRDREVGLRQHAAHVRRHVVRAFGRVDETAVAVRREIRHEGLEVAPHGSGSAFSQIINDALVWVVNTWQSPVATPAERTASATRCVSSYVPRPLVAISISA